MPINQQPTRGKGGGRGASTKKARRRLFEENNKLLRASDQKSHASRAYNSYGHSQSGHQRRASGSIEGYPSSQKTRQTPLGLRDRDSSGKIKQIESKRRVKDSRSLKGDLVSSTKNPRGRRKRKKK